METMWKEADPNEVRQVWGEELRTFHKDDLRSALDALRQSYKEWPPTLYQFADLCRDSARRRAQMLALPNKVREPIPDAIRARLDAFVASKRV